jgi:hypothetical protein
MTYVIIMEDMSPLLHEDLLDISIIKGVSLYTICANWERKWKNILKWLHKNDIA